MRKITALACFIMSMLTVSLYSQVILHFGNGYGKISFKEIAKSSKVGELTLFGPLSFRIADGFFFIVDSVGGKIIQIDKKGKTISEIIVVTENETEKNIDNDDEESDINVKESESATSLSEKIPHTQYTIEDIVPVIDKEGNLSGFWALDSSNKNKLLNINANGEVLSNFSHPSFMHVSRIERGNTGNIFIADDGTQKLFAFTSSLELLGAINLNSYGFSVSGEEDNINRIYYSKEKDKFSLVTTNLANRAIRNIELELPPLNDIYLHWVDEVNGEFIVTYALKQEDSNESLSQKELVIAKIGFDGITKKHGIIPNSRTMNRFIEHEDYENIYIGIANYKNLSEGYLEIRPFNF